MVVCARRLFSFWIVPQRWVKLWVKEVKLSYGWSWVISWVMKRSWVDLWDGVSGWYHHVWVVRNANVVEQFELFVGWFASPCWYIYMTESINQWPYSCLVPCDGRRWTNGAFVCLVYVCDWYRSMFCDGMVAIARTSHPIGSDQFCLSPCGCPCCHRRQFWMFFGWRWWRLSILCTPLLEGGSDSRELRGR